MQITDAILVPIIIAITEICKRLGLPKKYSPVVSIVLGLLGGVFYLSTSVKDGIIVGLALGLSASGLYSGTKTFTKTKKMKK